MSPWIPVRKTHSSEDVCDRSHNLGKYQVQSMSMSKEYFLGSENEVVKFSAPQLSWNTHCGGAFQPAILGPQKNLFDGLDSEDQIH